jgi:hypothetical protein
MLELRKIIIFIMVMTNLWSLNNHNTASALVNRDKSPISQVNDQITPSSAKYIPATSHGVQFLEEPGFVPDVVLSYEYTGPERNKNEVQRDVIRPHWAHCYPCQLSNALFSSETEENYLQEESS